MSWTLYTTLTARNRAIEAIVAVFALLWAAVVLSYAISGTMPLEWVTPDAAAQWHHPAVLLAACALHMTGTALTRPSPAPAILRVVGMSIMALTFGHLSWSGIGTSAAPTYAAHAAACVLGAFNAAKDARYAREVSRAA